MRCPAGWRNRGLDCIQPRYRTVLQYGSGWRDTMIQRSTMLRGAENAALRHDGCYAIIAGRIN